MSYGGESNAKKMARLCAWRDIINEWHAGNPNQGHPKVLVLSGPHAHDVRVATSFGVPAENITAVDSNPAALAAAKRENKQFGVRWIRGNCFDVLDNEPFGIIFLDFCKTFKSAYDEVWPRLLKSTWGRPIGPPRRGGQAYTAHFCIAGMYGRDGQRPRAATRQEQEQSMEFLKYLYGDDVKAKPLKTVPSDAWRTVQAFTNAGATAKQFGAQLIPLFAISYQSYRANRRGVPMLYWAGTLLKCLGPRAARRHFRKHVVGDWYESEDWALLMGDALPQCYGSDPSGEELRSIALGLLLTGNAADQVADRLCIDRATLTAWQAHLARGTYADNKKLQGYRILDEAIKRMPAPNSWQEDIDKRFAIKRAWHLIGKELLSKP